MGKEHFTLLQKAHLIILDIQLLPLLLLQLPKTGVCTSPTPRIPTTAATVVHPLAPNLTNLFHVLGFATQYWVHFSLHM